MVRSSAVAFIIALAAGSPAAAEEEGAPGVASEGLELLQEGTRLLLRGLMEEMGPGLREMQRRLGDLSAYHPPEVLPNGDILIRRRETPGGEDAVPAPKDDEGIEL